MGRDIDELIAFEEKLELKHKIIECRKNLENMMAPDNETKQRTMGLFEEIVEASGLED